MGNKLGRRRSQIDDRFTRPQGLYQHKDVDHKKLRRLIIDAKLAPCYPGAEDAASDLDECPICFLHYPSLNRSKCCTKGICTECFLQVKSPNSARPTQCPFCKTPNYAVEYRGAKTQEEKGVEQAEEQKVIEAKIRIRRQQEIQDEEARMQRREQALQVESPRPASPVREEPPSFPVFSGSTYTSDRSVDQLSGSERSWNAWTNMDSTAIGYPPPDFFNYNTSRADTDTPWHRNNQREFGRHHPLSSSSSFNTRRRGAISGEPGQGPGAGYPFYNREEDFDLDLEDIMVMEAIWLSIQEQGSQRPGNNSHNISPSPFGSLRYNIPDAPAATFESTGMTCRRGSVTGGFASAIAALAERQVAGSTASDQPSQSDLESNRSAATGDAQAENESEPVQEVQADAGTGDKAGKVEQEEAGTGLVTMHSNENNLNDKASSNGNLTRWIEGSVGAASDVLLDQGSEVVEAGTSYCSSVPSASELPWEAPESGTQVDDGSQAPPADSLSLPVPNEMLPESFEEQMMLAMALSLAEAQARSKAS